MFATSLTLLNKHVPDQYLSFFSHTSYTSPCQQIIVPIRDVPLQRIQAAQLLMGSVYRPRYRYTISRDSRNRRSTRETSSHLKTLDQSKSHQPFNNISSSGVSQPCASRRLNHPLCSRTLKACGSSTRSTLYTCRRNC